MKLSSRGRSSNDPTSSADDLSFIGLNQAGIVTLGVPGAPVRSGHLTATPVLVAVTGFLVISVLIIRRMRGGILLGILITAAIAFLLKTAQPPAHLLSPMSRSG
jgi:AGZA family xanthine/uracil permease-like MFS transporter